MRSSRALCILVSAIMLTSLASCGKDAAEESSTSSVTYSEKKQRVLFSGYIIVPTGSKTVMLYAEPSTSSEEVTPVYLNDPVDVFKDEDGWCYVSCRFFNGYIQKEYISLTEITETDIITTVSLTSSAAKTTSTETTDTDTTTSVTETTAAADERSQEEEHDDDSGNSDDHNSQQPAANNNESHHQEQYTPPVVTEYPSITVSLGIDPHEGDPEKYDFYMNVSGKYSYYKYEAYRVLPDGTEIKLTSGESSDSRILLAVHDSLLESGAVDKVKVIAYLNSAEGDPLELELHEPVKTW